MKRTSLLSVPIFDRRTNMHGLSSSFTDALIYAFIEKSISPYNLRVINNEGIKR